MKVSEIIKSEICGAESELMLLEDSKGKNYFNGIAIRNICSNNKIIDVDKTIIETELNSINLNVFNNHFEKETNTKLLTERLMNMVDKIKMYYSSFSFFKAKIIPVKIEKDSINVDCHFIMVNDTEKVVYVCKIKNSKCKLKPTGRTPQTSYNKNKELFLLSQVGEVLYPGYKSFGTIVFLNDFNLLYRDYNGTEVDTLRNELTGIINKTHNPKCSASTCSSCNLNNICNLEFYSQKELKKVKTKVSSGKRKTVSFTKDQEEFINASNGVYRVLAGAGAGKTTVIANNLVKLLKDGVNKKDILLITFSTKGVEELKDKIEFWIKNSKLDVDVNDLSIFTFNSYGQFLIENNYKKLGFTKNPKIIDKIEKFSILESIIIKKKMINEFDYNNPFMNLKYSKGAFIQISNILDDIKKGALTPFDLTETFQISSASANILFEIYNEYNEKIKSLNLIEFQDQINLAFNLVQDKEVLNKFGTAHIICDEFQDSDLLQVHLLKTLYSYKYALSLCVCGDDSQSIFSWRGANQDNILEFDKMFEGVKDIKMTNNFRSTKEICNMANVLNNYLDKKVDKKLMSSNTGKQPEFTDDNIVSDLKNKILKDISCGFNLSDIAIIARTKSSLLEIEKYLKQNDIPSYTAVSENICSNKKVQNIIKWFDFLEDYSLDLNFLHYLQIVDNEEFEINKKNNTFKKYIEEQKNIFLDDYNGLSEKDKIEYILKIIESLQDIDDCLKALYKYLIKFNYKSVFELVKRGKAIINYEADIFSEKENGSFDAVTLITAHSSKGKEWGKVYIDLDSFKYNDDEEMIRLLFVAVTRAKEDIVICNRRRSDLGDMLKGKYKKKRVI